MCCWAAGSIFKSHDLMEFRRRVGMLFQRPNPFPMSIIDNVVAGVRAHKMVPRKGFKTVAEARLTEVGLWDAVKDRLGDSPFRLSGGQQQLLCLARALAVHPEVLLLDEPTSSLDPTTTEKIEALIRSLANRLTVIMVTHDLAQAARIGDRTALFFDGRLIEEGPTEQVFLAPQHAGDRPLCLRAVRRLHDVRRPKTVGGGHTFQGGADGGRER